MGKQGTIKQWSQSGMSNKSEIHSAYIQGWYKTEHILHPGNTIYLLPRKFPHWRTTKDPVVIILYNIPKCDFRFK